jgi:hypothetical protein
VSDRRLLLLNVLLFIFVLIAIAVNALTHKHLDQPLSILSETCLSGDHGREVYWPAKAWSIVTLVIFQVSIILNSTTVEAA